ncbi:hypothetical protein GGR60_002625 [Xanthomonas arboricola]|uniref:hypothetical protein n=1 Tax=Xanthomonas euroxanthea TaxID=2259622 RepID=UPI00143137DB|nr:hypothetical protein [Xanthomonas euroxanthea]NJC38071.1 hypothetical protein [Xanthomonas euroxanthea]
MKILIPSAKQFKSWTMLNRIGYVGAAIGIFVGSVQLIIWTIGVYQWLEPAPSKLSAQDLLTIDQNPTKLEITRVKKEKNSSSDELVTFTIKNTSNVTAKNVRVEFYNYESSKSPYGDEFANGYNGNGVDIRAGETRKYKVALLSDYEKFFNPDDSGAPLLRVSTEIQSERPFELEALACGVINGDIPPCTFSTSGRSTVVDIRYGSIFGQKYHVLTQFYNTFLKGEVKFLPKLTMRSSKDAP